MNVEQVMDWLEQQPDRNDTFRLAAAMCGFFQQLYGEELQRNFQIARGQVEEEQEYYKTLTLAGHLTEQEATHLKDALAPPFQHTAVVFSNSREHAHLPVWLEKTK